MRRRLGTAAVAATALGLSAWLMVAATPQAAGGAEEHAHAETPIKHLVVIFQENVSFDHYFGTYPKAANPSGEPAFTAAEGTPHVDGLDHELLTDNPNLANPQRLDRSQQLTCDENHDYTPEQQAFDDGQMDKFVQFTATGTGKDATGAPCVANQVMDYYDGNTVTALWNYAQHFAMSDRSFNTTFGPSSPGAINLVSGQTHGVTASATPGTSSLSGEIENNTVIGDPQPLGDDCSTRDQVQLTGTNVGDQLNDAGVTWGWFEGGFAPTTAYAGPGTKAVCGANHNVGTAIGGTGSSGADPWGTKGDYIPHHEPFQYYASTANPHHLPPTSTAMIGHTDQANHQYDLTDFWNAVGAGHMPAVSFLKAPGYQDGHAGYSDPEDEQVFLVNTLNRLQALRQWKSTAVVIAYDDSDGWYDHVASPVVNGSSAPADALDGPGQCGDGPELGSYQDRCGYGPRLPLLVVSPWARVNYVDHHVTDQSSILRFIEDNWDLGRIGNHSFDEVAGSLDHMFQFEHPQAATLQLDPTTGAVTGGGEDSDD